jgi:beta-phosphoglucomutase
LGKRITASFFILHFAFCILHSFRICGKRIVYMKESYKALIFDLNGTMIDDMPYHVKAWHSIVEELGAGLDLEQVKAQCYGKNQDLLDRVFPGRFTDEEKDQISLEKEKRYQSSYRTEMKLIDGLHDLLAQAHAAGIKIAIGSAAIMFNIDFILDGMDIRHYIDAIVSADHVELSKPHPETFLRCATAFHLSPADCLVFEDAPKGVESAEKAGMDCMVITTMHTPEEFETYKNIVGFIKDYTDVQLKRLIPQESRKTES